MFDQIKNGLLRHVLRAATLLIAAAALASPAIAGTYRIDFYNGTFIAGGTTDYDGDGVVDYSGTFDAAAGAAYSEVTMFGVTIDGKTFSSLDTGSFPGAPTYYDGSDSSWPIPYIKGFVFDELFSGLGDTVDVLQMESFGIGNSGGTDYYGVWSISPCTSGGWCGGGQVLGSYTITPVANPVPTPATLPLAALGLLALAAVRRRTA